MGLCLREEAGARNLAFFRVKWLQPAMNGTSRVRRVRLGSPLSCREIDSFYVFCNNACSCVKGFAIESGSLEFDFFRWIHMYADCLARSHYI